jgi:hypothetical protein
MRTNPPVPTDISCPKCGKHKLAIRTAKTGVFLSCTGYALDKKKDADYCAHTVNLVSGDESEAVTEKTEDPEATEATEAETRIFINKRRCVRRRWTRGWWMKPNACIFADAILIAQDRWSKTAISNSKGMTARLLSAISAPRRCS